MNTETPVAPLLSRLLDRLRHELCQYGEILALLDQQQASVMARSADDVLHSVGAINEQMARIQTARQERAASQADVAAALQAGREADFSDLLPRLPAAYQPAVAALVRENNELLVRVQQRARQNHLLLSRSVELMQRFVNSLLPAPAPLTYNGDGRLQATGSPVQPRYQAVG